MRAIEGPGGGVRLGRTEGGVALVEGADDLALAFGLGVVHGEDRLAQMELVRLACQGRLCECLAADATSEAVDVFMRRLGLHHHAVAEVRDVDPETARWLEAYAQGVNRVLETRRRPLELLLVGHRPAPWSPEDSMATVKVMGYVGLAEGQGDAERWIVELLRRGVDPEVLRRLFSPHLDGLDDELVALLQDVTGMEPLVPPEVRAAAALPRLRASNNWAVAGSRSASGKPLQANDPHLEGNRLPAIWAEAVLRTPDDYRIGITMPGLPGIVMGRNSRVSAGFTYGFMDQIDLFLEDCADGAYRAGEGPDGPRWVPFDRRVEAVHRKGKEPLIVEVWESSHGVLDGSPHDAGLHLLQAWSGRRHGGARSLWALRRFQGARDVGEAREVLREVAVSCNWLVADVDGSIALQQSGLLPDRAHSGLHPLPGWVPENRWRGFVDPARLRALRDPEDGVLVTANEDQATADGPLSVNLSMGPDRAARIRERLGDRTGLTVEDMREIQADLHSRQAERSMELLRPLLPDTERGRALAAWDLRYATDAREPVLFEHVWSALMRETFAPFLGEELWAFTVERTAILVDFFHRFDAAFLGCDPRWFPEGDPEGLCRRVLAEELPRAPDLPWGAVNRFTMTNLFFGGRLPGWLGFDVGPIPVPGGRATPCQGQVFESHGRRTSFVPSWRYATDMAEDRAWTALAGGPSGSRFSGRYTSDVERWRRFEAKPLDGRPDGA